MSKHPTTSSHSVPTRVVNCDERDARIAALERDKRNMHGLNDTLREAVAEAEAELVRLKAKCDKCPVCNPHQPILCDAEGGTE